MKDFVVTISRGYGSGGKTIGKMLADALHSSYYDDEVLRMASETSGINERIFAKADERINGPALRKPIGKKGVFDGGLIPPDSKNFVSEENLFNYQAHIIRELARKESCVIIGRAADYVLEGFANVIRVNIQAPFENCVQTVMERLSVGKREAERLIRKTDNERAAYYQYYTGRAWNNALHYDLTINSARTGWDACVELIKNYVELKCK